MADGEDSVAGDVAMGRVRDVVAGIELAVDVGAWDELVSLARRLELVALLCQRYARER